MSKETPESFNITEFQTEMTRLLKEWHNLWSPIASGTDHMPMWIAHMDPDAIKRNDLESVRPQQAAIDRAIDYAAHQLILAEQTDQAQEAYETMEKLFSRLGEKCARTYFSLILPALLLRTLKISHKPTDKPTAVDTVIEETRQTL